MKQRKQIILGVSHPFVGPSNVWDHPDAGHPLSFGAYTHLARTAEAACFDFVFLAESLRPREHRGRVVDLESLGRPDTVTVLAALAAVTTRMGLTGTMNTTFREPYELARQLATLDHLSGGRTGWNLVTTADPFTGANFRRGGFLDPADRYTRAAEFLDVARGLWDSRGTGDVPAEASSGRFLADASVGEFTHAGRHFTVRGRFDVPRGPQGGPVVLQSGDSPEGREFAAASANAVFTHFGPLPQLQAYYADIKARVVRHGRSADGIAVLPSLSFALGDTPAQAVENHRETRLRQVSGAFAIARLEQVWRRDLSAYDPDGPMPDVDPDLGSAPVVEGLSRDFGESMATAARWRGVAQARGLSIRELVLEVTAPPALVGTPEQVADAIGHHVDAGAADGFVVSPSVSPHGLDEFAARVVPLLQERGSFRAAYAGSTLREHLGLASQSQEIPAHV
jgi:FMN-dependent oxidoreductase (nitrilotriacetate monooxygenase family)